MEILWLLAGHLLGDFPFQSDWMAREKGKSWEILLYHALVYTATMLVVATIGGVTLSLAALTVLFGTHFVIDPLKARWHIIKHIWIDQLLHVAVIIFVFFTLV